MRPPRVLTRSFPLMTVPYTAGAPCSYWTLTCLAVSSALHSLMGFLFVSPVVCSRLPSDSTSRWTPLPFSYPFPTAGQGRDFHPIERAPAGRTKKTPCYINRESLQQIPRGVCLIISWRTVRAIRACAGGTCSASTCESEVTSRPQQSCGNQKDSLP